MSEWTDDDVQSLRNDLADTEARLYRARHVAPVPEHAAERKVEYVASLERSVRELELLLEAAA